MRVKELKAILEQANDDAEVMVDTRIKDKELPISTYAHNFDVEVFANGKAVFIG